MKISSLAKIMLNALLGADWRERAWEGEGGPAAPREMVTALTAVVLVLMERSGNVSINKGWYRFNKLWGTITED